MVSKHRVKGTAFETLVSEGFKTLWPDAHRLGMQGSKDCGDIWLPAHTELVVEAKTMVNYTNRLSTWLIEAQVEAATAGRMYGVVVHKRVGKANWEDQYLTTDLATFLGLMGRNHLSWRPDGNRTDRGGTGLAWG